MIKTKTAVVAGNYLRLINAAVSELSRVGFTKILTVYPAASCEEDDAAMAASVQKSTSSTVTSLSKFRNMAESPTVVACMAMNTADAYFTLRSVRDRVSLISMIWVPAGMIGYRDRQVMAASPALDMRRVKAKARVARKLDWWSCRNLNDFLPWGRIQVNRSVVGVDSLACETRLSDELPDGMISLTRLMLYEWMEVSLETAPLVASY